MSLLKSIIEAQGGDVLKQLAGNFNMNTEQAGQAVSQLLPALTGGIKKNMGSADGLGALMGALQKGNHSQYLDNPSALTTSRAVDDGNGILGHILGSKDASRQVAAQAAQNTGLDVNQLKKMLPMVAAMAMGGMSKQVQGQSQTGASQGGGLGDMIGGALGSLTGGGNSGGGIGGMLNQFLDGDKDGSVLDDVMGFARKLM
ncbi:MAG: DUF937 domain-containing protein [Pseudomonadota bacterium]